MGIVLAASGLIITGCSTKDNNQSNNSTQPVEKKEIKTISLDDFKKNLTNSEYQFVDTRDDSSYNGFKGDLKNGGHLKNAIQYSATFVGKVNSSKEAKFVSDKGLDKNKKIVLYDTNKENINKVADKFSSLGYEVYKFEDYKTFADDDANKTSLEVYPEYQNLVSPEWVNNVNTGKGAETYSSKEKPLIFEVSWGEVDKAKGYKEHIKGAYHLNTDLIEEGPVWNIKSADELKKNLLKLGITANTPVILYSDDPVPAYRVNWALRWAGVKDVRVMNGTLKMFKDAGFETETTVNTPKEASDFGINVPAHPEFNISRAKDMYEKQQKEGIKLVSNRSWDEYLGKISGYDYISKAGEPKGAIYGFSGDTKNDVNDYYDPDGTLRNPQEIYNLWAGQGITATDKIALYCGTGWRNSVPWFMTQMTGRANTYFFDGGWNDWQLDGSLPVDINKDKGSKPDAKNDYK